MPHSRDLAFYLAAAITGIAAAYVLNELVLSLWHTPTAEDDPPLSKDDDPPLRTEPLPPLRTDPPPPLPPLRIDPLPPPLPILDVTSPTAFGTHANDEQEPSDTESFVQVLSPPTHGLARRRSMMRAHDLFAASHISFAELGSLVAPSDEEHDDDH